MRILISDDDLLSRKMVDLILREAGHETILTDNGEDAWEVLSGSNPPDVAIIDWMMPKLDGLELCRRLRQQSNTPYIYFILLTAKSATTDIQAGFEAGVDDYLPKPLDGALLHQRLRVAERIRNYEDEVDQAQQQISEYAEEMKVLAEVRAEQLVHAEAFSAIILDGLSAGVILLSTNQLVLSANKKAKEWFPELVENQKLTTHFLKQKLQLKDSDVRHSSEVLRTGTICESISRHVLNGRHRWVRTVASPIRDGDEKVEKVVLLLEDVTEREEERRILRNLADQGGTSHLRKGVCDLVGSSLPMQIVYSEIHDLADTELTVLVAGETGTGKELAARALHQLSSRAKEPFVAINCGALSQSLLESELFGHVKGAFTGATHDKVGLFQSAGAGTVFLDEIEAASPAIQRALLRVLDHREVTPVGGTEPIHVPARVLAAANQSLEELVEEGKFRQDLRFRLAQGVIQMPPLRERVEDITALANTFAGVTKQETSRLFFSPKALEILSRYLWPGNVRELKNLVRRLAVSVGNRQVQPSDIPSQIVRRAEKTKPMPSLAEQEHQLLIKALTLANGNVAETARLLGIARGTVYSLMRKHHVHTDTLPE